MASDRAAACADLISGGMAVDDAMRKAGYGRRFIDGHAYTFAATLASWGLLTTKAAKSARRPARKPKTALESAADALDADAGVDSEEE